MPPSDEPGTFALTVIRTDRTVGLGQSSDDPVHGHIQYFTKDGELLAERCTLGGCDHE